jgi:hypothetical protein
MRSRISVMISVMAFLSVLGGKCRLVDYLAANDVESSDKREPIGVNVHGIGSLSHEFRIA